MLSVQYVKQLTPSWDHLSLALPNPRGGHSLLFGHLAITAEKTLLVAFVSLIMSRSELHTVGRGSDRRSRSENDVSCSAFKTRD